jgi:hypothetical protein
MSDGKRAYRTFGLCSAKASDIAESSRRASDDAHPTGRV